MSLALNQFTKSISESKPQGSQPPTGGAALEAFTKDPVLLQNHRRPHGNCESQMSMNIVPAPGA